MLINQDLNHIEEWAKQWIVKFSPSKTESMVLSLKTKLNQLYPRLLLSNTPIANVQSHKHIGPWILNNFKWDTHINSMVDKCSRRLGILKTIKYKLHRGAEYADIIWSWAPQPVLSKLSYITNEAIRVVTDAPVRSSTSDLYSVTGWLSFSKRREIYVLKMMFNIANNLSPSYLSNIVPPIIRELPLQVGRLRLNEYCSGCN